MPQPIATILKRSNIRRCLLLLACLLTMPLLAWAQEGPKPSLAEVLREDNLRKLRLQLPNKLHTSGPEIQLPSGRKLSGSVIWMMAEKQQAKTKWTLEELAEGLAHEDHHVRYASLCLLVHETGITDNWPSFMMSREELESSGVVARWKKIALEHKKPLTLCEHVILDKDPDLLKTAQSYYPVVVRDQTTAAEADKVVLHLAAMVENYVRPRLPAKAIDANLERLPALLRAGKYRLQMAPVLAGGRRMMFLNLIHVDVSIQKWRTVYHGISDGGIYQCRCIIDLAKGEVLQLDCNGYG